MRIRYGAYQVYVTFEVYSTCSDPVMMFLRQLLSSSVPTTLMSILKSTRNCFVPAIRFLQQLRLSSVYAPSFMNVNGTGPVTTIAFLEYPYL